MVCCRWLACGGLPLVGALLVACAAAQVSEAAGQVTDTRPNAIAEVIATLIETVGGCPACETSINPEPGQWGVLAGRFVAGEGGEILFNVTVGTTYLIAGKGDANAADLDICVYDQDGAEVDCDELPDSVPVVEFTARSLGAHRAVLTAYDVGGDGTTYAGMTIFRLIY